MGQYGSEKMFGGTCHLLNGNMVCGVYKDYLIVRVGKEQFGNALGLPHTKPFDITGRPMKGWVMVEQRGVATQEELKGWLAMAKKFVQMLPAK